MPPRARVKPPPPPGPDLPSKQNIFTAGEAAYLLCVSPRQINMLMTKRLLHGFRVNRDRRIPRDSLIRYMLSIGMPLDLCLQGSSCRKGVIKPRDMK